MINTEGVSHDKKTSKFSFDFDNDQLSDIINLVKIRNKVSKKHGVLYYVPFVALPKDGQYTTEYKLTMNSFREKLKKMEFDKVDEDKIIDHAIRGLVDVYGDKLKNIGIIVTPKSSSRLNQKIAEKISGLIPTAHVVNDAFIKNSIDQILINTEKIVGTPEQKADTANRMIKILNKFKDANLEFKMAKIHPKFRNLFSNFMKLSSTIGSDVLEDIKTKDVLVIDDFLTKGLTMKELNRLLKSQKESGEIINFVLILQG